MTTPPINLTQLRERANYTKDHSEWHLREDGTSLESIPDMEVHPDELLALIDTAEAAIDLLEHLAMIGGGQKVEQRYLRLRETLNHYTTTP
jgi:hypothetical protein